MSDLYRHYSAEINGTQEGNLLTLARHLVRNADAIDARRGLLFGTNMRRFRPLPGDVVAGGDLPLPPLAYGPHAGIAPKPDDDWRAYCARSYGIHFGKAFIDWLQSEPWQTTEPSTLGAGLRIIYVLEYGIPWDADEIAAGRAGTDYDTNGFAWDRLDMLPANLTADGKDFVPLRAWPSRGNVIR